MPSFMAGKLQGAAEGAGFNARPPPRSSVPLRSRNKGNLLPGILRIVNYRQATIVASLFGGGGAGAAADGRSMDGGPETGLMAEAKAPRMPAEALRRRRAA